MAQPSSAPVEVPRPAPDWGVARAGSPRIETAVAFTLAPLRGSPIEFVAAGEASMSLRVHPAVALGVRVPFLATPGGVGSPDLGASWVFYEHAAQSRVTLLANLRLYAPLAPEDGSAGTAAAALFRVLPFSAPAWERSFTVSPGFAYHLAGPRYALRAEVAIQTATTGRGAPQVAVAYLLAAGARIVAGLEASADVAGRAVARGGAPDQASLAGLGVALRYRAGALRPFAGVRIPLGSARQASGLLVEIGLEAAF